MVSELACADKEAAKAKITLRMIFFMVDFSKLFSVP
jgi:hypothetical protein